MLCATAQVEALQHAALEKDMSITSFGYACAPTKAQVQKGCRGTREKCFYSRGEKAFLEPDVNQAIPRNFLEALCDIRVDDLSTVHP